MRHKTIPSSGIFAITGLLLLPTLILIPIQSQAVLTNNLLIYYDFEPAAGGFGGLQNVAPGANGSYGAYKTSGTFLYNFSPSGPGFGGSGFNAHYATYFNNGSVNTDRSGLLVNNALNLVSVRADAITVPIASTNLGNHFTISVWHKLPLNAVPQSSNRFFVFEAKNNYRVSWGIGGGDTYASYVSQTGAKSATLPKGSWHHVVHVFSNKNTSAPILETFVNGNSLGTQAGTSAVSFTALYFGRARDGADNRHWDGMLDELAIWNRALTAAEVTQLYNLGLSGFPIVNLPRQLINFAPTDQLVTAGTALLSATGGASGNPVVFNTPSSSVCSISGNTVTLLAPGTCIVNANQLGDASHLAAPQVTRSFLVLKADQSITLTPPNHVTVGDLPFVLTVSGGNSGNPVTLASSTPGVCAVTGTTLTPVSIGTCTIIANQLGNVNYNDAPQVTQDIPIHPAINVRQIASPIPNGDNVELGPSDIDYPISRTFTIDNLGQRDLLLTGNPKIRLSGPNAGEFRIEDQDTLSSIPADNSTTFTLLFEPTTIGNKIVTLTIPNNGSLDETYFFTVSSFTEPHKNLHINLDGTGQGTVSSNPEGIECPPNSNSCSLLVANTPRWITLTPVPATGSKFLGWTGDPVCQNNGKVLVSADTTCTATFVLQDYELSLGVVGQGKIQGPGIDCPTNCQAVFPYGSAVQLTAIPDREWVHSSWRWNCDQTGLATITAPTLCHALFEPDSSGPNIGDGNGDGILDALQPNVITLPEKVANSHITFEVLPETCAISDVYTDVAENYGQPDKTKPLPQGLIYFEIACSEAQISLYYHAITRPRRNFLFRKFGPTVPGNLNTLDWYNLPNVTFSLASVGNQPVIKATYTLKDGELGDSTGIDGRIVDPGGIGFPSDH